MSPPGTAASSEAGAASSTSFILLVIDIFPLFFGCTYQGTVPRADFSCVQVYRGVRMKARMDAAHALVEIVMLQM